MCQLDLRESDKTVEAPLTGHTLTEKQKTTYNGYFLSKARSDNLLQMLILHRPGWRSWSPTNYTSLAAHPYFFKYLEICFLSELFIIDAAWGFVLVVVHENKTRLM